MRHVLGLASVALASLVACSSGGSSPQRLTVSVAPLALEDIGVACYDLAVTTAHDTVWTRGSTEVTAAGRLQTMPGRFDSSATYDPDRDTVCSDRYGNGAGGDIALVGACDASADADLDGDTDNGVQNLVTVWVDGLYDAGRNDDVGDWQDPCPSGCSLMANCSENADSRVDFDLTVMRRAQQGFFDVAVNFDDVFCSSKLDSCDDDGAMRLLFGDGPGRDWTAVFGLACSAGPDADTVLRYGEVKVECDLATFVIDPKHKPGNAEAEADGYLLHYGVYRGDESLPCAEGSCAKRYWNLAFDLDDLAALGECRLSLRATVVDGVDGWADGLPTAVGLAYPYIVVDAPLASGGSGVCLQHELNDSEVVQTVYNGYVGGIDEPLPACDLYDGTVRNDCACDGKEPGDVCGPTPEGDCAAPPTCEDTGFALLCTQRFVEGEQCRAARDVCDRPEYCEGDSVDCPADELWYDGYQCRAAVGGCDVAETCDGVTDACPADSVFGAGHVCDDGGVCELDGVCDGVTTDCSGASQAPSGTACDGGTCDDAGQCVVTCNPAAYPFGGGNGTVGNPYLVCTQRHLEATEGVSAHFLQVVDLVLTPSMTGLYYSAGLVGNYDGGGHTIDQVVLGGREVPFAGLFGAITSTGVLSNVKLTRAHGTFVSGQMIGLVAGTIEAGAYVHHVVVDGIIEGGAAINVGGFVGVNRGVIEDCAADVSLNGASSFYGGFVGQNSNGNNATTGIIRRSHASGGVECAGQCGGFAGAQRSQVYDSWASGDVVGGGEAGGFAGKHWGEGGTIASNVSERCWATGDVSGSVIVGGFVGTVVRSAIRESWSSGHVTASSRVGGFAGESRNDGDESQSGSFYDCWTRGAVTGGAGQSLVGGFIGGMWKPFLVVHDSVTISLEVSAGSGTGGGFVGWQYSTNYSNDLTGNFSGTWWLASSGATGDSSVTVDLPGVERAELPADGSSPSNWANLDFTVGGPWAMAHNTGALAAYAGPVPVLKIQCGVDGVTCL